MHDVQRYCIREQGLLLPVGLLIVLLIWGMVLVKPQPVPDFASTPDVQTKKLAFFAYLEPHVRSINAEIARKRQRVLSYRADDPSFMQEAYFRRISVEYLNADELYSSAHSELLNRVDEIPLSLALVQAAKESGWGTSRFAREGYNFFGQQCFNKGCGFTPRNRSVGRHHEVAKFRDARDAVRSYIHNLNTHSQYKKFRELRTQMRQKGDSLNGIALAEGLEKYSERGMAYVEEVQAMIRANELE